LILLSGMTLAAVEARSQRRLAAHAEAERALETAYEALRGGLLPLVPGDLPGAPALEGATLRLEVAPAAIPALYEIRLVTGYRAGGGDFERRLQALLWRP